MHNLTTASLAFPGSPSGLPLVAASAASSASSVSMAEVVAHRAYLVRFALRKLGSLALAEDAVHDVFEAVLSGRAAFGGRAALRSWLTGVLKHKIVDTLRRDRHHEPLDGEDGAETVAASIASPAPGPCQIAEQRELLKRTLAGIDALPRGLRDAFCLHVIEEQSTEAVCARLAISETNLFVRVHRARKQLAS